MQIQLLLFKVFILHTCTCDVVYRYYMMFIHYDDKLFLSDVFSVHPRFANHYDISLFYILLKTIKKKKSFFLCIYCAKLSSNLQSLKFMEKLYCI